MPQLFFPHEVLLQRPCGPPAFPLTKKGLVRKGPPSQSGLRLSSVSKKEDFFTLIFCLSCQMMSLVPMRVPWPIEPSVYQAANTSPTLLSYFCDVMVKPVLQLFYLLRTRNTFSRIHFTTSRYHDCDLVMFNKPKTDYFIRLAEYEVSVYTVPYPPVIALIPTSRLQGIINSDNEAMSDVSELLQHVWHQQPESPIICCDLQHILTFYPDSQSPTGVEARYQSMAVSNLATFRIVLAAYLFLPLLRLGYLLRAQSVLSLGPLGPRLPQSKTKLRPDRVIFSACQRHSDFDYVMLYISQAHARQFFRWKDYMLTTKHPQCVVADDVLKASTHSFSRVNARLRPYYPTMQPLEDATWQHIKRHSRAHPFGSFTKAFMSSAMFSLRILWELTVDKSDPRLCRTYVCQLLSVDNRPAPVGLPALCLKLYDDRFFPVYQDNGLNEWETSESFLNREVAVYTKLASIQGSLIPYYMGAHSFELPNGMKLDGILMEYVQAPCAEKEVVQSLSRNEQLQLMQSVRHAVRVLQYADISQHDWHPGQILVNRVGRGQVHCVLIDFGGCTQSMFPAESHRNDDFGDSRDIFIDDAELPEDWVAQVFGRREVWDLTSSLNMDLEDRYNQAFVPFLEVAGFPQPRKLKKA